MSLNFLHLPREIRDLIYAAALTSPTSHLLISIHKTAPGPGQPRSNGIRLQPYDPTTHKRLCGEGRIPYAALQRTTRQIRAETENWVWRHNTIVFLKPSAVMPIFKLMGQGPSRYIQRVRLYVNETWDMLDERHTRKVMSMLASRTRKGDLRHVGLVLDLSRDGQRLPELLGSLDDHPTYRRQVVSLMKALRKGAAIACEHAKVQRSFEVLWEVDPKRGDLVQITCAHLADLVTAVHCVWDGMIWCNGELIWDSFTQVQKVSTRMLTRRTLPPRVD